MTTLSTIETTRDINLPMEKRNTEPDFWLPCYTGTKSGRQLPHLIHGRQHGYFHTLRLVLQRHPRHTSKKIEKRDNSRSVQTKHRILKKSETSNRCSTSSIMLQQKQLNYNLKTKASRCNSSNHITTALIQQSGQSKPSITTSLQDSARVTKIFHPSCGAKA